MSRSSQIAWYGISIAALIYGGTLIRNSGLQKELDAKVVECEQWEVVDAAGALVSDSVTFCDPILLKYNYGRATLPIQAEIVGVQSEIDSNLNQVSIIAMFIVGISLVPALWYFLLRRLAEVSAAVRGDQA